MAVGVAAAAPVIMTEATVAAESPSTAPSAETFRNTREVEVVIVKLVSSCATSSLADTSRIRSLRQ